MTVREAGARFDPFVVSGFVDGPTCRQIVAETRLARGDAATVYGQEPNASVNESMRRATHVQPSPETVALVKRRLFESQTVIADHFRISLNDGEVPQFLRYAEGGVFVAHQDGNSPLRQLERDRLREVSVIILLNRQSKLPKDGSYEGGSLVVSGLSVGHGSEEIHQCAEAGTLVAFRSETTHEVTSVTGGERFSIVSWYK